MADPPFLLVIAGPNGSGKSTLTDYLVEAGFDFGEYINPDQIAARLELPEPERSKQAQTIADFQCRTVLFDNSALVVDSTDILLPNPKAGLCPVGEMIGDGKNYEISLESEVPTWVFEHLVKPLDELARGPNGAITLTIHQNAGPLG